MSDINAFIDTQVKNNDVFLFMKARLIFHNAAFPAKWRKS